MAKVRVGGPTRKYLTKDELLGVLAVRTSDLELPPNKMFPKGALIKVTGLAAQDGIKAFQGTDNENPAERLKRIMLLGIVEPRFSEEDIELLGDSQVMLAQLIVNEIMVLSGLSDDDTPADFLAETPSSSPSSDTAPKFLTDSPAS